MDSFAVNFLLLVAGTAFVWTLLAALVGNFADRKGRSGVLWFGLSLICSPLIGFVVIALLPSAANRMPVRYSHCPNCFRTVTPGTDTCPYCNANLSGKHGTDKRAA